MVWSLRNAVNVVIVPLAILGLVLIVADICGYNPFKRNFEALPQDTLPDGERIRHPLGFSVWCPKRWIHDTQSFADEWTSRNSIWVYASSGRYADSYSVGCAHESEVQQEGMTSIDFQNEKALYRFEQRGGSGGFEDPSMACGTLFFTRGERWYKATFLLIGEYTEPPDSVFRLLETFEPVNFDSQPDIKKQDPE